MSEKTLFFRLVRMGGLTETAAAAMLGNWQEESGIESARVQGDMELSREKSKRYTTQVDSGFISRWTFAHDEKGYGFAQWTYFSRKEKLHKFAKARGVSIGDENMQCDFAIHELKTEGEYRGLYDYLKTTDNLYEATERICTKFERPAVNNISPRYKSAQAILERYKGTSPDPEPTPNLTTDQAAREVIAGKWGSGQDRINRLNEAGYNGREVQNKVNDILRTPADGTYWPPRELSLLMEGNDISVWQSLLIAHGYVCNINGIFDADTEAETIKFQKKNGLPTDGVARQKTWDRMLAR